MKEDNLLISPALLIALSAALFSHLDWQAISAYL
jgi:hypothetical protein